MASAVERGQRHRIDDCTVSGNTGPGDRAQRAERLSNNTISNNRVGTDAAGMAADPQRRQGGVAVLTGAYNNYVVNNTISGNTNTVPGFQGYAFRRCPGTSGERVYQRECSSGGTASALPPTGPRPLPNVQGHRPFRVAPPTM